MNNTPQIFHGEWWVPAVADHDTRMIALNPEELMGYEKKYTGTLTYYGDKNSSLELYHVPSNVHSNHYNHNIVMWGRDANGLIYTLFNVAIEDSPLWDFTNTKFVVGLILIGEHVLSLSEDWTKKCVVYFPYLNNWVYYETQFFMDVHLSENSFLLQATSNKRKLSDVAIHKGTHLRLFHRHEIENKVEGYRINRKPYFEIETTRPKSLEYYLKIISELEQFLSIALYSEQNHSGIEFLARNGDIRERCKLLVKKESSEDPSFSSLIKYVQLKEKLPLMLSLWHKNFDKVAPISGYLIDSIQRKNRFDVPDFLIVAQALDGYYKRFINVKNLKELRGYEFGIKSLLEQFEDVDCIKKCKINPKVLTHSRDKYSHLLLDKDKPFAVDGWDLYWLTEKCKVLLTCCILNLIGLTNEEINLCCANSPISQIVDSLPLEPENE